MNLIQKAIKKAKDFIDEKDRNGMGYNRSRREY